MLVGGGEPGARVDHEQDRVAIDEGCFRLRAHAARERFRIALFKTGGVDDGEGKVGQSALALAAIAGDARLVVDQRQPAPNQPIEQRRLADVRPADDRDLGAHVISSLGEIGPKEFASKRRRDVLRLVLRAARSAASRRMLQTAPTGAFFEAPLTQGASE